MTQVSRIEGSDANGRARRAGALGRVLWSRALPGSVAVIAALTIPEFSVGAGDLDGDMRRTKPLEPDASTGQRLTKPVADAAKVPLSGVRYGGLLAIRDVNQKSAGAAATASEAALSPVAPAAASSAAILPSIRNAPPLGVTERGGAATDTALHDAATYAATLLDGFVLEGGLQPQVLDQLADAPKLARPEQLDVAASYAAMTLDRFAASPGSTDIIDAGWDAPLSASVELQGESEDAASLILPAAAAKLAAELAVEPGLGAPLGLLAAETPPEFVPTTASALSAPTTAVRLAASAPSAAPPAPAPLAARAPVLGPVGAVSAPALGTSAAAVRGLHQPLAFDIKSQLVTRVDGKAAGKVDFQQTTAGLSVRLGSIVSVLSDRYDPGEIARITASEASNTYIPLAALQAQGIPISYDPVYDEFNIGENDTRPKAARKVHIDQISAPERGLGTAAIGQVRR